MVKECALKENSCEFHQTRLSVNKRKAAKMRGSLGSGQGTEMRTERQVHDADSFSVSFSPDRQKAQSRKAVLCSAGTHLPSLQPRSWGQAPLLSNAAPFIHQASRVFLVCLPYPSLSFDYTPPWEMSPLGIITAGWRYTSLLLTRLTVLGFQISFDFY